MRYVAVVQGARRTRCTRTRGSTSTADVQAQDHMAWETQGPIADRDGRAAGDHRPRHRHAAREMLKREIEKVQMGLDPMNVYPDPNHGMVDTAAAEVDRLTSGSGAAQPRPRPNSWPQR